MPSIYDDDLKPLDLDKDKTYPLASRASKVNLQDFAKPIRGDESLNDFLASLPNVLAGQAIRELAERIRRARELKKPIIWGMGGHVIKCGLAPLLTAHCTTWAPSLVDWPDTSAARLLARLTMV